MTSDSDTSKPRRRWYQFSLRTLLILVTLSAVPLGWVGSKMAQARREQPAIEAIEGMGGYVAVEDGWLDKWIGGTVYSVGLPNTQVSDLTPLAELNNLTRLDLYETQVSDLSPLAELTNLEALDLAGTQVTDLSPLVKLEKLEWLLLEDTQVSEEQLQTLRKALPDCEILH